MAVLMWFGKLNPHSVATQETGIKSTNSTKVLKSGNFFPNEITGSCQDSLKEGFPDSCPMYLLCLTGLLKGEFQFFFNLDITIRMHYI